jgi:hypothetical protein
LISLLDPTSIADPSDYDADDIAHLFVRRHRHSPEVASAVGDQWAEREEPEVVPVVPSPAEEAVFQELSATWLSPQTGSAPCTDRLFPWTLFKAAASSPMALAASVASRIDRQGESMALAERAALDRLGALAEAAAAGPNTKFETLTETLSGFGVVPGGEERVVIFSERVDTLDWLAEQFQAAGWGEDELIVFHSKISEQDRLAAVKEFSLDDTKVGCS